MVNQNIGCGQKGDASKFYRFCHISGQKVSRKTCGWPDARFAKTFDLIYDGNGTMLPTAADVLSSLGGLFQILSVFFVAPIMSDCSSMEYPVINAAAFTLQNFKDYFPDITFISPVALAMQCIKIASICKASYLGSTLYIIPCCAA